MVKNQMGLAEGPELLIKDMADYLMKAGVGKSYLDSIEVRERGLKSDYWNKISRGLLNPFSFEGRFFYQNLESSQKEARRKYLMRRKYEMARKKRLKSLA